MSPIDAIVEEYVAFDRRIDPFVTDTTRFLNEALAEGKRVLAEGAQGALLDVDHGTYPYVTSSHPTAGGCSCGHADCTSPGKHPRLRHGLHDARAARAPLLVRFNPNT